MYKKQTTMKKATNVFLIPLILYVCISIGLYMVL